MEVSNSGLVLQPRSAGGSRFWTWAGLKANATLLAGLGLDASGAENESVRLPDGITARDINAADPEAVPILDDEAISGLKFSAALPEDLAAKTIGERLADTAGAEKSVKMQIVQRVDTQGLGD
jgi:ATP-dependent Lhr-like helicase